MSYENANTTELVATNCCVCRRALVDAVSVETGIGPVCREKHGYNVIVDDDTRSAANQIVYQIAANQNGPKVFKMITELNALGFALLASRIAARLTKITIKTTDGGYLVRTGYSPETTSDWRALPGRRWNKIEKANFVPTASKAKLFALLKTHFSGHVAYGPKGMFEL